MQESETQQIDYGAYWQKKKHYIRTPQNRIRLTGGERGERKVNMIESWS